MATGRSGPENCKTWISDEKKLHLTSPYGENSHSVNEALQEQKSRHKMVADFKHDLSRAGDTTGELNKSYDNLTKLSGQRLHCLEDISKISGLEEHFGNLTFELANRANSLSQCPDDGVKSRDIVDGADVAAQNCILAVKKNWSWISCLVQCTDVHLQHAADYHQFYHLLREYKEWMPAELKKALEKVASFDHSNADKMATQEFHTSMNELMSLFLHWQCKLNKLMEDSKKVVPVHLRTTKLEYARPVSVICDYKTKDMVVEQGEDMTLLDNSEKQNWLVRNRHATEARVPSIALMIPGPDPDAIRACTDLSLQLLHEWTSGVKKLGKGLIFYLLMVLKEWNPKEAKQLKAMPNQSKTDIDGIVESYLKALSEYWKEYDGYKTLAIRSQETNRTMQGKGEPRDRNKSFEKDLKQKLLMGKDLLGAYDDMWTKWQTYKMMTESMNHPELLLIAEKWQKLNFVDMDVLKKFWHSYLDFDSDDQDELMKFLERLERMGLLQPGWRDRLAASEEFRSKGFGQYQNGGPLRSCQEQEEVVGEEECIMVDNAPLQSSAVETIIDHTKRTAETSEIHTSEQEEKKTFVITGVVDPRSKEEVSMQQAVMLGIINSKDGTYNNPDTGESMPIPVAMNAGMIKVEFTTTKKSAEKRRDVGLITIKTERESRPYTVTGVVDAKTDEELSVEEAVRVGLLDQKNAVYHNPLTKQSMSLGDALDSGLLLVEFDKDAQVSSPEVVTLSYAIHSVVDQRKKERISFEDAVKQGLIDKATGAYFHNVNRESIYVGEAIKRGFIKASVVKDPNSLNIDNENKMVVDKLQTVRRKLLNPLLATSALRKAGAKVSDEDLNEGLPVNDDSTAEDPEEERSGNAEQGRDQIPSDRKDDQEIPLEWKCFGRNAELKQSEVFEKSKEQEHSQEKTGKRRKKKGQKKEAVIQSQSVSLSPEVSKGNTDPVHADDAGNDKNLDVGKMSGDDNLKPDNGAKDEEEVYKTFADTRVKIRRNEACMTTVTTRIVKTSSPMSGRTTNLVPTPIALNADKPDDDAKEMDSAMEDFGSMPAQNSSAATLGEAADEGNFSEDQCWIKSKDPAKYMKEFRRRRGFPDGHESDTKSSDSQSQISIPCIGEALQNEHAVLLSDSEEAGILYATSYGTDDEREEEADSYSNNSAQGSAIIDGDSNTRVKARSSWKGFDDVDTSSGLITSELRNRSHGSMTESDAESVEMLAQMISSQPDECNSSAENMSAWMIDHDLAPLSKKAKLLRRLAKFALPLQFLLLLLLLLLLIAWLLPVCEEEFSCPWRVRLQNLMMVKLHYNKGMPPT